MSQMTGQKLLRPVGALAVLFLDLAEERYQFLVAFLLGILNVLVVELRALECVIKNADEIVHAVVCSGCHSSTSHPADIPLLLVKFNARAAGEFPVKAPLKSDRGQDNPEPHLRDDERHHT